jgi:hypothetical protein
MLILDCVVLIIISHFVSKNTALKMCYFVHIYLENEFCGVVYGLQDSLDPVLFVKLLIRDT